MSHISGYVYYCTAGILPPSIGISNVPVTLYDTESQRGAVVLTDETGGYLFTNVPSGNYNVIESWGETGSMSPVDYSQTAMPMTMPPEVEPPLSALSVAPPPETDYLDAISSNTIHIILGEPL